MFIYKIDILLILIRIFVEVDLQNQKSSWETGGGSFLPEEKKVESRWVRALRSIKCSEDKAKDIKCNEMVKDKVDKVKDRERAAETGQRGHQAPRGHLLRVNSCSHLPTTTATNIKGEIQ